MNMIEFEGKNVTFLCTSKCNINCEHCYISFKGERDPEQLLELVKILKSKYKIMINGAEILTNLGYLKSCKEIGQPWVMTNGLELLKQNVIEELIDNNIKSLSISYHFGIHEEISKVSLETLKKILETLKNNNLQYRFLTTITSKNYSSIEEFCSQAYEMGAKGIMFTNLIRQGNGINLDKNLLLNSEQLKEFFDLIKCVRNTYTKDKLIIERSATFGNDDAAINNHFCCEYGMNGVCITPDNKVYPCIFMAKPGYEIGEVVNGKIMIYNNFYHDTKKCIAKEVLNEEVELNKVLKYKF